MYQAMPTIRETAEELRAFMKAERRPKAQQRLHALYLITSGQAQSRSTVAKLLGVNRETVGAWLMAYTAGGLERLLDIYIPAGKTSSIPPNALADLCNRLQQPEGFESYGEIQTWLAETYGIRMKYAALHKLVAYKLKARPKIIRSRYKKKP